MIALRQFAPISISEYLDGEEHSPVKHDPSLKALMLVDCGEPAVTVYRRKTEGGFAVELHSGRDAVVPLPEIDASLTLAGLYESAGLES